MTSRWRWILVVTATTSLDLLARFGASFDIARVMHVEAVLFPVTGLVLASLQRSDPGTRAWPKRIRVGLVWLFGLGALRPLLWTLGAPLMTANLATLATALVGILVGPLRRRYRVPRDLSSGPANGAA
jgi:hypothetical protein